MAVIEDCPPELLPEPRFVSALGRYVHDRLRPGGFLCAVLMNDLAEAISRADSRTIGELLVICKYVYNCLPAPCWGSKEKVEAWLSGGSGE